MEFEYKTKIIEELIRDFLEDPEMYNESDVTEFFAYNDLGIPLAQAVTYDLVEKLSPEGFNVVNETWIQLCTMLEADPEGDYENLDDVFLADGDNE